MKTTRMPIVINTRPLRPSDLNIHARYLSPRGLMCRLKPAPTRGMGSGGEMFFFEYQAAPGDGFWLTASNVGLMRKL